MLSVVSFRLPVTSVRDGMNLVPLKFATVNADRPAGIVLSSGCGSHDLLARAAFSVEGASVLSIQEGLGHALAAGDDELSVRGALVADLAGRRDAASWGDALMFTARDGRVDPGQRAVTSDDLARQRGMRKERSNDRSSS